MLDPAGQQSSTGGYPWRIEGGSSTYVYIKNVSDKSQQYHLQLSCEVEGQQGEIGVYSPGLVTIESGQTITLDIRRLRDEQVADEAGRLIPVEVNRGQVLWSVRGGDNLSLIGRAEQADDDEAVSSTYACQNCCENSFNDGWCDPFSAEGIVGSTEQFTANQQDRNCYGTVLSSYVVFASWSSSNTSVATVNGNGLATAQGPGSTDIFASWFVSTFLSMEGFPQCIEDEELFFVSSVCTVLPNVKFIHAKWENNTVPFPDFGNTVTLDIGADPCIGGTFSIKVRFDLRNSTVCCLDDQTFVRLSQDNIFELVNIEFSIINNDPAKREVTIFLKRRADGGGSTERVTINIQGSDTNGNGYEGEGFVKLRCP